MTSWFTYQGGVPSKKGADDSVSEDTEESDPFFQKGETFPEEPRFSPSSHPGSIGFSSKVSPVRYTWVTVGRLDLGSLPGSYLSQQDTVSSRWLPPRISFPIPLVNPSRIEVEPVSSTLDIATTGSLENVVIGNARATVRFNAHWRPAVACACLRA